MVAQQIKATPLPASAVEPGAARLFARAAKVYGNAKTLSFDYQARVSDGAKGESGSVKWMRPNFYAVTQTAASGATGHAASDGKLMYVTAPKGMVARFALPADRTYLQVLGIDPPMYYFTEFVGGTNPLKTSIHQELVSSIKALPAQNIGGAPCDGLVMQFVTPNPIYEGMARGSIRMWFDRKTGLVARQSWSFALEEAPQIVKTTTTDYTSVKLDAPLGKADFFRPDELAAPLTEMPKPPAE